MSLDSILSLRNKFQSRFEGRRLCLPEGNDQRIQDAAQILEKEFKVNCLLGTEKKIALDMDLTTQTLTQIAQAKSKPMPTETECKSHLNWAGCQLHRGEVDAVVAGCVSTTADVVKSILKTVGSRNHFLTSAFLMVLPDTQMKIVFADCAVIPNPTTEGLVRIAMLASEAFQCWTQEIPKIAFLSFSTRGSATHLQTAKVTEAAALFREKYPRTISDGELQFDAAFDAAIAHRKNPNGTIKGDANVFVFPDLNSGNIAYKMAQYLAKAQAWGPVMLGANRPYSDLSRGASVSDIVAVSLLTLALGQ